MILITSFKGNTKEIEAEKSRAISIETTLAVGAKWSNGYINPGNPYIAGWNLYCIEGGQAELVETYDTEDEARQVRDGIIQRLLSGAKMVIV